MAALVNVQRLRRSEFAENLIGFVQQLADQAGASENHTAETAAVSEKMVMGAVDMSMIDLYG
jgi:hypothetical protein